MNEPLLTIRAGRLADLARLVSLEQACFAVPWSEDSLRRDLAENPAARILVAEMPDGSLAGYAAYWSVLGEGQINNIAVAPDWRRLGVGRRLLLALVSQAVDEGLRLLTLEVRPGNLAARQLYESVDFQEVGRRAGYYADNGEDAIIMLKYLV
jgi:[ribosomal protein S18]-alanine N-acetyltransferase